MMVRLDSTRARGGVAIYVNTNYYPSSQLKLSTDIEAIVVTVKLNNNDIVANRRHMTSLRRRHCKTVGHIVFVPRAKPPRRSGGRRSACFSQPSTDAFLVPDAFFFSQHDFLHRENHVTDRSHRDYRSLLL